MTDALEKNRAGIRTNKNLSRSRDFPVCAGVTGSAVGDLTALCASPGFFDADRAGVVSGLATALHRDPDKHEALRRRLVRDGTKHVCAVLERAVDRGEVADDLDVDLLSAVIPAMVLFQMTYRTPGTFDEDFVSRIITDILTPVLHYQT